MCYDRLVQDDTVTASARELLRSEWYCALRNGLVAGVMVLSVLLLQGGPAWIVAVSVGGAVVLGAALHQVLLLVGAGVMRARARWRRGPEYTDP